MVSPIVRPRVSLVPRASALSPSLGEMLSGLNQAPAPAAAASRMTAQKNGRKMARAEEGIPPMKVLLVAQAGLFAEAFAGSLAKLARGVEVQRCDPERLEQSELGAPFGLVVIDVDALPGGAVTLVNAGRKRFDGVPMVALASALDENYIATIMGAGAHAYLPKSYSEAQALGVLHVLLDGVNHAPHAQASGLGGQGRPATTSARHAGQPGNEHPYGLTDRELEVLTRAREGLSNLQIAKRLGITEGTVKIHLSNCYDKLGVESRVQAIRIVERLEAFQHLEMRQAEEGHSLRDWLLPHMCDELHRRGDVLFRKGDPGRALYFLQQGSVLLPEIGVRMSEGELFGEIGIFAPEHARTCSACCETDCRLFCLTAEQAKRLYFENPQFAYHVVQLITRRLLADRTRPH